MKPKHTPGPWFLTINESTGAVAIEHESGFVSDVDYDRMSVPEDDYPTLVADHRLMAAAPDLLAACDVALAACQANIAKAAVKDEWALVRAIEALRPAIAKATGAA